MSNRVAPIAPFSPGQREGVAVNSSCVLGSAGTEFAPSHVFRQLHKIDIAAEAALRADRELVDRQMLGRLVETTPEEVRLLDLVVTSLFAFG